jgi:hypothetical protein
MRHAKARSMRRLLDIEKRSQEVSEFLQVLEPSRLTA